MKNSKVTSIRATSRASVKIKDSFYTFEFCEEHQIINPDEITAEELANEKQNLWDSCNEEVDKQIEEISNFLLKK